MSTQDWAEIMAVDAAAAWRDNERIIELLLENG
jgi:hypothetical protein